MVRRRSPDEGGYSYGPLAATRLDNDLYVRRNFHTFSTIVLACIRLGKRWILA
jgi:hypothetical protein